MNKRPSSSTGGPAASVLVFVLLILMVGALVLGGVAQRAATQNLSADIERELTERRIMLRNSRALARQFVLERMFFGYLPFPPEPAGGAMEASFTNTALGGFSLTNANPGADFWQTVSEAGSAANVNPFSPLERGGFYRVILPAELWNGNGTNTVGWNYLVRSRSPVAAGYSLVLQRPAVRPSSAVTFENSPYIDFLGDSPAWVGFPDMPVVPVSAVTNTLIDPTGYRGFLDVPLAIAGADGLPEGLVEWEPLPNAENITGWRCVIDLALEASGIPPDAYEYQVPGSRQELGGGANQLPVVSVLLRGTTNDLPPLQLRMTESPDVEELILEGENRRSLYVNRRAEAEDVDLIVVMTEATVWRMGVTMQGAPITLLAPGLVTLVGGVRTDTEVAVDSAALVVQPDRDPRSLDFIGDRLMWLEDNRQ